MGCIYCGVTSSGIARVGIPAGLRQHTNGFAAPAQLVTQALALESVWYTACDDFEENGVALPTALALHVGVVYASLVETVLRSLAASEGEFCMNTFRAVLTRAKRGVSNAPEFKELVEGYGDAVLLGSSAGQRAWLREFDLARGRVSVPIEEP